MIGDWQRPPSLTITIWFLVALNPYIHGKGGQPSFKGLQPAQVGTSHGSSTCRIPLLPLLQTPPWTFSIPTKALAAQTIQICRPRRVHLGPCPTLVQDSAIRLAQSYQVMLLYGCLLAAFISTMTATSSPVPQSSAVLPPGPPPGTPMEEQYQCRKIWQGQGEGDRGVQTCCGWNAGTTQCNCWTGGDRGCGTPNTICIDKVRFVLHTRAFVAMC